MDHLFHKNILQEKNNLEWRLAEANAKIEQLQRTISSLQEKKQNVTVTWRPPLPNWHVYKQRDGVHPDPIQGKDGRWYSPNPNPPPPEELPKPERGLPPGGGQEDWEDDWRWGPGEGPTVA